MFLNSPMHGNKSNLWYELRFISKQEYMKLSVNELDQCDLAFRNEHVLPIPGAKNSQQATENAGALSFSLTPAELEALSQATMAWRV
jgi:diketogulonate reductase-like aldo/keto reductase